MVETGSATIRPDRLAGIKTLAAGARREAGGAPCAMEAVAFIAGEPRSDRPACASPALAAFVGAWNDGLAQPERDALILPLLPRLVGTRGSAAAERRRIGMAMDWMVRTHLPAWFHLAKLHVEADAFSDLPELTDIADLAPLCDALAGARKRAAVPDLTLRLTGAAVRSAAWDAAHRAAWSVVNEALEEAGSTLSAAGWDTAYAAAYAATRAYGKADLEPTRRALERSAATLLDRMIRLPDGPSGGGDAGRADEADTIDAAPSREPERPVADAPR